MRHEKLGSVPADTGVDCFWPGILSAAAICAIARKSRVPVALKRAAPDEALILFSRATQELELADENAVRRMLAKNPDIVQTIHETVDAPAIGLFAFLPLNEFGAMCLTRGQFDGTRPDPAWITRPGEKPVAIYIWLAWAPGIYLRSQPAIGALFRAMAPEGCALFTRGVTSYSDALHQWMGFQHARFLYPAAPDWLLVALPARNMKQPAAPQARSMEIRQVRSFEELAHVYSIRSATYLAEQLPLYAEEFDGNDFCATHLVGYIDGDPAGAIRMRYFGDFVKVERLAVKLEYRKSKLAFRLVREAVHHIRQKGFRRVYGHASDEIAPFWRILGAHVMEGRPAFRFANIEYREMTAELEPDPLAIRFGVEPMVSIRPEGLWDEPGALDYSNLSDDTQRLALMQSHAKDARQ